jgi:hypothetical protein
MRAQSVKSEVLNGLWVMALVLIALPFAIYAFDRGLLFGDAQERVSSRLFDAQSPLSSGAVYLHMVTGGLITALAPLQLLRVVRHRVPLVHRVSGYAVALLAAVTGTSGLIYIVVQGTIGGVVMDIGFGVYGALMMIAAWKTVTLARARHPRHALWAQRLVILAVASWLYRVHYGLWEILTGGIGSDPDFSGPFDQVQVFAFYLPYLFLHDLWWRLYRQRP